MSFVLAPAAATASGTPSPSVRRELLVPGEAQEEREFVVALVSYSVVSG
jgi:hypothetical protein